MKKTSPFCSIIQNCMANTLHSRYEYNVVAINQIVNGSQAKVMHFKVFIPFRVDPLTLLAAPPLSANEHSCLRFQELSGGLEKIGTILTDYSLP